MADDLTQSWELTYQDKAMLQDLLDNPPAPTPKLLALFDSHKDFNKVVGNVVYNTQYGFKPLQKSNRLIMSVEHLPS